MLEQRKQQVRARIEELTARANQLWGAGSVPAMAVRFDLRGRNAGQAGRDYGGYFMRFNIDMMQNEGWDHIFNETVPHELAHVICFWKNWDRGHGAKWKSACRVLGGSGQRCHSETVTYAKGKTFYYTSSTGQVVAISSIRHGKIQRGASYTLRTGGRVDRTCAYKAG
jgi:predicted SprT family Zn-dependent metalloprotease